jgi:hypothetical protein
MQSRRHPQIVNLDELEATEQGRGRFRLKNKEPGRSLRRQQPRS